MLDTLNSLLPWDEPASVWARGVHKPKLGACGKLHNLREVPETIAAELEAVDADRETLNQALATIRDRERAIIDRAFKHGRPLTMNEVEEMTEKAKAAKAAAAAATTTTAMQEATP